MTRRDPMGHTPSRCAADAGGDHRPCAIHGTIVGRCIDERTDQPLQYAQIFIGTNRDRVARSTRTGRYRLTEVPAGARLAQRAHRRLSDRVDR